MLGHAARLELEQRVDARRSAAMRAIAMPSASSGDAESALQRGERLHQRRRQHAAEVADDAPRSRLTRAAGGRSGRRPRGPPCASAKNAQSRRSRPRSSDVPHATSPATRRGYSSSSPVTQSSRPARRWWPVGVVGGGEPGVGRPPARARPRAGRAADLLGVLVLGAGRADRREPRRGPRPTRRRPCARGPCGPSRRRPRCGRAGRGTRRGARRRPRSPSPPRGRAARSPPCRRRRLDRRRQRADRSGPGVASPAQAPRRERLVRGHARRRRSTDSQPGDRRPRLSPRGGDVDRLATGEQHGQRAARRRLARLEADAGEAVDLAPAGRRRRTVTASAKPGPAAGRRASCSGPSSAAGEAGRPPPRCPSTSYVPFVGLRRRRVARAPAAPAVPTPTPRTAWRRRRTVSRRTSARVGGSSRTACRRCR